jgi:hypothetical protein
MMRTRVTRWLVLDVVAVIVATAAATCRAQLVHPDSIHAPPDTTVTAPADKTTVSQHPDALAQVAALEEKRRRAMVAADVNTLATIIAADATYVHSTGIMQNRDELLRLLSNQSIQYLAFDVEKTAYRVYGGTVVGTGVQKIKVMQGRKSMVIRSRYTVVYAERNGTEELIAYQSTPLPEMTTTTKK